MSGRGARLILLASIAVGCRSNSPPQPAAPATWRLSSLPTTDIGVAEGDQPNELAGASSSLRLADGRIVIANSGSYDLRFFDNQGRFLHVSGRKGAGPGEFDGTMHLIPLGPDRFAVFAEPRLSVFDTAGTYLSDTRISGQGQESFPLTVWLYRRNWVDGPVDSLQRPAVAAVLDQMPPIPPGAYRFIKVADGGRVWAQVRTAAPVDSATPWRVYGPTGRLIASISIPADLEIHQIGPDFILGRRWAENQVEHIQLFRIEGISAAEAAARFEMSGEANVTPSPEGDDSVPQGAVADLATGVRELVMAQEMYYADANGYAEQATDLQWKAPAGTTVHLMLADKRGWVGLLAHQRLPVICGMAVGGSTPPGWTEGSPKCSLARLPPSP